MLSDQTRSDQARPYPTRPGPHPIEVSIVESTVVTAREGTGRNLRYVNQRRDGGTGPTGTRSDVCLFEST